MPSIVSDVSAMLVAITTCRQEGHGGTELPRHPPKGIVWLSLSLDKTGGTFILRVRGVGAGGVVPKRNAKGKSNGQSKPISFGANGYIAHFLDSMLITTILIF